MEEEQEKKIEEEKKQIMLKHASNVRNQISENDDVRKQHRMDYLEEGKKTRQNLEEERQKILEIKEEKLQQLGKLHIDQKYMYEL